MTRLYLNVRAGEPIMLSSSGDAVIKITHGFYDPNKYVSICIEAEKSVKIYHEKYRGEGRVRQDKLNILNNEL